MGFWQSLLKIKTVLHFKVSKHRSCKLSGKDRAYDHYVKSVRIWSFSGPYFPALGLNTESYGVAFRNWYVIAIFICIYLGWPI